MRTDYSFIALFEFDDVAGLHAYLDHPAHAPLAASFFSVFEDALMYDYDVGDGEAALPDLPLEPPKGA